MAEQELPPAGVFAWQRTIDTVISSWRPRSNQSLWGSIGGPVQAVTRVCGPRDESKARQIMSETTKLATFAHQEKYPLALISGWLSVELIERFIAKEFGELTPSTQSNHRRLLHQIHDAFHGTATRWAAFADIHSFKPYDEDELAALWSLPSGQTPRRRNDLKTLLALVLGCGLSPTEAAWAQALDIRRAADGTGPVSVAVRGNGARLVMCHRRWEDELWKQAQRLDCGPVYLIQHGREVALEWRTVSVITTFVNSLKPSPETPEVVVSRLRATWLMELVDRRPHTATILAAAGPEATTLLERLRPHLRSLSPAIASEELRG